MSVSKLLSGCLLLSITACGKSNEMEPKIGLFEIPLTAVRTIRFLDNSTLCAACGEKLVYVNLSDKTKTVLEPRRGQILDMSLFRKSSKLVFGDFYGRVNLVELVEGKFAGLKKIVEKTDIQQIDSLTFSADGKYVVFSAECLRDKAFGGDPSYSLYVFDLDHNRLSLVKKRGEIKDPPYTSPADARVSASPKGPRIATCQRDGQIHVWELKDGKMKPTFSPKIVGKLSRAIRFSPDGRFLAVAGLYRGVLGSWIRVLDSKEKTEINIPQAGEAIEDLSVLSEGKYLVTVGGEYRAKPGDIVLWRLKDSKKLLSLKCPGHAIRTCDISPDEKTLATGTVDGKIVIWDLAAMISKVEKE